MGSRTCCVFSSQSNAAGLPPATSGPEAPAKAAGLLRRRRRGELHRENAVLVLHGRQFRRRIDQMVDVANAVQSLQSGPA